MYVENYSEGRSPHRLVFTDWRDALIDINKWMRISNVSISVWKYRELEQKKIFNTYNNRTYESRMGPKWDTAIVDKMFFDFDCLDEKGKVIVKPYDSMVKLWKWAEKRNYRRDMAFTGGGYQGTIDVKCEPHEYVSVMRHLEESMDLEFDSVSLADLRRVVGSFNFGKAKKSERNRYCISLTEDEIELPFETHREISKKQRLGINHYGYNSYKPPLTIKQYRKRELEHNPNFTLDASVDDILDMYGYNYNDICSCVRALVEQPHVKHKQRLYVISYLKNVVGIQYGDMNILLPKLLNSSHGNGNDGSHAIGEGQVRYIYSNESWFSTKVMKQEGYCYEDCDNCWNLQKELSKLL